MSACLISRRHRPGAPSPAPPGPNDRYAPRPHPELRHHRAYRPREIHPGRSADPGDRRPLRPRDEGAGAGQHGVGAGARHHHQGADRPAHLPGQGRADLRSQPHGHARPRGLRLRGVALARRLRGIAAGGGRVAGGGGADARQRLPGDRRRARDRPRAEQDRPAGGRAGAGAPADRGRGGAPRRRRGGDQRQDRAEHRGGAGSAGALPAGAEGGRGGAAQGAAGGQLVRPVSRRGDPGADQGRTAPQGPAHPHDGQRPHLPCRAGGRVLAEDGAGGEPRAGRDGLPERGHQDGGRHQRRRHHHRRPQSRRVGPARLQAFGSRGLVRPLPRGCRRFREAARIPWASSG